MITSELARNQMVRHQVRTRDVFDERVLSVLQTLPRDAFVPGQYVNLAYADVQLSLPHGQVMMTPGMEGRLLQSLALEATDKVLEIGTGSGFLTACLSGLCDSVVSIEIFDDLLESAEKKLGQAGIENVTLATMDATEELPEGPFDAIAVTGSLSAIDTRFVDILRPGGRLFLVAGSAPTMEAFLIVRGDDESWYGNTLFETEIPALIDARQAVEFSF